jgi:hypothetical protein
MKKIVIFLVILLIIIHQDFWWWNSIDPLAFGFIPVGLTWHVCISIAAAIVWALAMKFCWPEDVDIKDGEVLAEQRRQKGEI